MHRQRPDQPQRIDSDVSFAPVDLFAVVASPLPPFWTVFTDWLLMMAMLGSADLPAFSRTWTATRHESAPASPLFASVDIARTHSSTHRILSAASATDIQTARHTAFRSVSAELRSPAPSARVV